MNILIVGGGYISSSWDTQELIGMQDYIIAADSGCDYLLSKGYTPDILMGDFDSISEETLLAVKSSGGKILEYPPEKNYTDSELAIVYALEMKPSSITMIGFTGSRMDHTLGNLSLLKSLDDRGIDGRIVNETNEIRLLSKQDSISLINENKYKYISLLPISEMVRAVSIVGVKYPLRNKDLSFGETLSISNEMVEDETFITKDEGSMYIILSND